jgi:cullin-4
LTLVGQPEEAKKAEEGIETDRKYALDAAIVRVMKSRKERTFEQLKLDVVDAVKNHFVPDIKEFKKRVLVLIESEYLRRDEDNPELFFYIA